MKDMQRIENLFKKMHEEVDQRFDEMHKAMSQRFDRLEADVDEMKVQVARIPFIERKLDSIKVVVGGHSSQLINHEARIGKLERRR